MNSRKTGLLRLKHLREQTEAKSEQMANQRQRFERLKGEDAKPRVVSSFNLFQTPPELAAQVVDIATPRGRVLEPSAGLGRLYTATRGVYDGDMTLVEISPDCCSELYRMIEADQTCRLVQDDFLNCDRDRLGLFDCVVMNPPFKMGRDIKHINHARSLVAPGGVLVSVCANGPRQNAKLKPEADEWIVLPAGSFKSEGTRVETAIAVFRN